MNFPIGPTSVFSPVVAETTTRWVAELGQIAAITNRPHFDKRQDRSVRPDLAVASRVVSFACEAFDFS